MKHEDIHLDQAVTDTLTLKLSSFHLTELQTEEWEIRKTRLKCRPAEEMF